MDMEQFSTPLDTNGGCGEDLEDSLEFSRLESLIEESIGIEAAAEDIDWKTGVSLGQDLLKRSRDVRLSAWLTRCLLETRGIKGLAAGLALTDKLLRDHWDCVFPVTEEGDPYPIARFNAIGDLSSHQMFLAPVQKLTIVELRGVGSFTYRNWLQATGAISTDSEEGESQPQESTIIAAFENADSDQLGETYAGLQESSQALERMSSFLREGEFAGYAPDLEPLKKLIVSMSELIARYSGVASKDEQSESTDSDFQSEQTSTHVGNSSMENHVVPSGYGAPDNAGVFAVNSRRDAEKALDMVCDYFKRVEPSSPVPLLIRRAKSLLHKDFTEILRDFAPAGLSDIEKFSAEDNSSKAEKAVD